MGKCLAERGARGELFERLELHACCRRSRTAGRKRRELRSIGKWSTLALTGSKEQSHYGKEYTYYRSISGHRWYRRWLPCLGYYRSTFRCTHDARWLDDEPKHRPALHRADDPA